MKSKIPKLSLSGAVVIAGILIALAIVLTARPATPTTAVPGETTPEQQQEALRKVRPVSASDHVRGPANAPITIYEYSDLDCPFCERFHGTMEQIVREYPNDVRWVYRHFPLDGHPNADNEAVAAECVNKIAGAATFWQFLNDLLKIQSSQSAEFDPAPILVAAAKLGVDTEALATCMNSDEFESRIMDDVANAAATGGNGTPWSIIATSDGTYQALSGAQPYTVVQQAVSDLLK